MNVMVLPGDGIGPEITAVAVDCLTALSGRFELDLAFHGMEVGFASPKERRTTLDDALNAALEDPATRTPDVGGKATAEEFGRAVVEQICREGM